MSMLVEQQLKDKKFISIGDRVFDINIILKGSVNMQAGRENFVLESGSVIGLMECAEGKYICDFIAAEDTLLVSYSYKNAEDLKIIFDEQPQYVYAFLHASSVTCKKILDRYSEKQQIARELYLLISSQLREYQLFCDKFELEEKKLKIDKDISPVNLDRPVSQWECDYVAGLLAQPQQLMKQFYMPHQELTIGELFKLSQLMCTAVLNLDTINNYNSNKRGVLLNKDHEDLLELWFDLAKRAACTEKDYKEVLNKIRELQNFVVSKKLFSGNNVFNRFQEVLKFDYEAYEKEHEEEKKKLAAARAGNSEADYFEYIINYAGIEDSRMDEVHELLADYREVAAEGEKDPDSMIVRNRMYDFFYEVYEKAFFRAVDSDEEISPIMKLFFNFGFMDSGQVSSENIQELFKLNQLIEETENEHIFTVFRWLKLILEADRETSKNEFDLDYHASLRELRKANKIAKEDEKKLQLDRRRMVKFEIENMFRSGGKGTFGRGGIFTPILSDENLTGIIESMYVSGARIQNAIKAVVDVDFGCFYREVMFYDPDHEATSRMYIQKEVMPDVILFPNTGQNAMMWQESEGIGRETSARFLFPILTVSDINSLMLETIGRYRWEICKKIQGMRWNDISERSLTSEYYDYLEFSKKNKNLTPEAREKVKNAISKAKGNYREVFMMDYVNWIKFESKGNFRLNKVSRDILARYCPFPLATRMKLLENPMFRNVFSRYENLTQKNIMAVRNAFKRYKDDGGELTDELMDTLHFYEK